MGPHLFGPGAVSKRDGKTQCTRSQGKVNVGGRFIFMGGGRNGEEKEGFPDVSEQQTQKSDGLLSSAYICGLFNEEFLSYSSSIDSPNLSNF